jgi:hypothetical protein
MAEYYPTPPPGNSPAEMWMFSEFQKISQLLQQSDSVVRIDETNVAPSKPRNGDLRLADGTNWNPSGGRGIYWYNEDASAWTKL